MKIIIKIIYLFPVADVKHLIVTQVSNTCNAWILFSKTWMATENCYYKKLLKDKLTSSCKDTYNHFKFSIFTLLLHYSWLLVLYFPWAFHLKFNYYKIIDVSHRYSFASSRSVFSGDQCFGKNVPPSKTLQTFHKSFVIRFLTVCYTLFLLKYGLLWPFEEVFPFLILIFGL